MYILASTISSSLSMIINKCSVTVPPQIYVAPQSLTVSNNLDINNALKIPIFWHLDEYGPTVSN